MVATNGFASAQSSLLRSMDQLIWNISRSYFSASAWILQQDKRLDAE